MEYALSATDLVGISFWVATAAMLASTLFFILERHYKTRPHNIGHLIAHSVHDGDPFRHYSSEPLEIGMVLTNEPGLYGHFEMIIDDEFYSEDCGIRIEDQLLITDKGCQNLTKNCPKSIDELEHLLAPSD